MLRRLTIGLCLLVMLPSMVLAKEFSALVADLNARSFNDKLAAVEALQTVDSPQSLAILKAMLNGDLYVRKSDDSVVLGASTEDGYRIINAVTGEDLGEVGRRDVKSIRINNNLRRGLRTAIAAQQLNAKDPNQRLIAANDLVKDISPDLRELIEQAYQNETITSVKEALGVALGMIDLDDTDAKVRLNAVRMMSGALDTEVVAALRRVQNTDSEGAYLETSFEVRQAAAKAIDSIESRLEFFALMENLFFGLSLGSVLLLAAIGLAITFGVMGVINMAHGEMIMLGAYTTYVVQMIFPDLIEVSVFIAIPSAFLIAGLVGVVIERGVIRHLYGRPLETLLATFGISLILQQAVRTIFSPLNRQVITPDWMSGSMVINGALSLTYNRLYIVIFSLLVFVGMLLLLRYTFVGLQMRAVTQNRPMADSMGIRTGRVDALTFGLGSGIAGIAGVALSQLTNVGPNLGQAYIIDSFMVVVFGGVGNLFGTFFAAMGLGIINKFLEPFAGAVLGKIIVLIAIILFIQWRPRGLFALRGRSVED